MGGRRMSNPVELLRRALDYIDRNYNRGLQLHEEIRAFLDAEPEAEPDTWQDLTDEEIDDCKPVGGIAPLNDGYKVDGLWMYDFADAVQEAVQEKNSPPKPEQEAEPVAWGYKDRSGEISACISRQSAEDAGTQGDYKIPLYTRPEPKRKPMTEEEITDEFGIPRSGAYFIEGVFAGVRFAEKYHKIGDKDG
jgi:hypothetical protein